MKVSQLRILLPILSLLVICSAGVAWTLYPYLAKRNIINVDRQVVSSTLPLSVRWDFRTQTPTRNRPLLADGLVLVQSEGHLQAVLANSGRQAWEASIETSLGLEPVSHGNSVIFQAKEHTLNAVNLNTGDLIWTVETDRFYSGIAALAVDETRVYIEYGKEPHIVAYSLQDGRMLWTFASEHGGGFRTLAVKDSELYVFIAADLYVLDVATGKLKSSLMDKFEGGLGLRLAGSNVYQSFQGGLIAKDIVTGLVRWRFEPECAGSERTVPYIAAVGERVYVGLGCNSLYSLDPGSGQLLWQLKLNANTASDPVVMNDLGYVLLIDGSIIGFDLSSGKFMGKIQTSPGWVSPYFSEQGLDADGHRLFATFGDRTLLAFE